MRNNFEQYDALLNGASEVTSARQAMEGGAFFLAWSDELIRELTEKGYVRSAILTARKLCEAVGVEMPDDFSMNAEKAEPLAWLCLFTEALRDCMKGTQ